MNNDRLRLDLADLADEVAPVDLRDRALRTSRRLGIQRAIATSAAAVVMLGAATGTAFALVQRNGGQAPTPADTPSVTFTPPPTEVTPTPTSDSSATTEAPSTPATKPGQRPVEAVGTVYYEVDKGGTRYVYSLRGRTMTRHLALPTELSCVSSSLSVSPDGKRVAWVVGNDMGEGQLTVANLDGSGKRTLPQKLYCLGNFPAWTGDSAHLKVMLVGSGTKGLIDLASGRLTAQSQDEFVRDVVRSANGSFQAHPNGDKIVVRDAQGALVRQVRHGDETAEGGFTVTGVSDDGRYVAVGPQATDPSRIRAGSSLFDTVTGRNVPLAVKATPGHVEIYLGAGGALLIRVSENGQPVRLCQVSASGDAVCRQEPAQLGTHPVLIGYRQ